jgi:tetratricopeptide (TPR) repeat protein
VKFCLLLICAAFASLICLAETNNREDAVAHVSAGPVNTNDPVELEYRKLVDLDDAAMEEVDHWIQENERFAEQGGGVPKEELHRRIQQRVQPVRTAYEDFLKRNPKHARAHLLYASFLEDIHDEEGARDHMLKAKEADPKNPAAWNNLANYYGHFGDVTNAFTHYEKAIELDPKEPIYYHNFGTTMYLFRVDAQAHYHINEQQVFDKALSLYSNSVRLDPTNFLLATDIAMTYYGIKPTRTEDALNAWGYALKLADGNLQREGVMIHLARFKMNAGRFNEARADLNTVTNSELMELKARVLKNLELREHPESATNAAPITVTNAPPTNSNTNSPAP